MTGFPLKDIAAHWSVEFKRVRPEIVLAGSPERSIFRAAIEDDAGRVFVMEKIPAARQQQKETIARALAVLAGNGLSRLSPYLPGPDGRYILPDASGGWQISAFVAGEDLDRQHYMFDGWRGVVLAEFLLDLREKSALSPAALGSRIFSIKDYIHDFCQRVKTHRPGLSPELEKFVVLLEKDFFGAHDNLPVGFCHGDYHPLNVIWSGNGINAVIDWEFCGIKPEIYDAANMVGCLGMEDPQALGGEMVRNFILALRQSGKWSKESWRYFPEFILAIRFAWLSEWLRKDDKEMIDLELTYFDILVDNRDDLAGIWQLGE